MNNDGNFISVIQAIVIMMLVLRIVWLNDDNIRLKKDLEQLQNKCQEITQPTETENGV